MDLEVSELGTCLGHKVLLSEVGAQVSIMVVILLLGDVLFEVVVGD